VISVAIAAVLAVLGASPEPDQLLGIRMGMTFEEFGRAFPGADCTGPGPDGWRGVRVCTIQDPEPAISRVSVRFRPAWGDRAFSISAELDRALLHRDFSPVLTKRFGTPRKQFAVGENRYGKVLKVWEWSSRDLHVKYGQRLFAREWHATVVYIESPAHAKWIEQEARQEDARRPVSAGWARTTRY
jgi:hypothetical protein